MMIELVDSDFYVSRFAVKDGERGTGIAQRLLAEIEERALASGCDHVALEVSTQHARAIRFWTRSGFQQVGRASVRDPERDLTLEYLHMRKPLATRR